MDKWLNNVSHEKEYHHVVEEIKSAYRNKVLPLEKHYKFDEFHSPSLQDADFDAKPMILLIGQYSTGKSTFVKYILGSDFPGLRIGPEPTTDRFVAVMHGNKEGVIPGNAAVIDENRSFCPLSKFGNTFLNRFQVSLVPSPLLKYISIIDTPGILSGERQNLDRGYDFEKVLQWFAERADRIILLFDAYKIDISDEFRRSIAALKGHDDKVKIVLNKSDMLNHQELMRVYGALMWSLGKLFKSPEAPRVYIGSFWNEPLCYNTNRKLFVEEEQDLFMDLRSLPRNSTLRKLNDLSKRARLAKVHAYIIAELGKSMPILKREGKKIELIEELDKIYMKLQRKYLLPQGDFPDINKMREALLRQNFSKFPKIDVKLINDVTNFLQADLAPLAASILKVIKSGEWNTATNTALCVNMEDIYESSDLDKEIEEKMNIEFKLQKF